jgi:hypothetical protein
MSAFSNRVITNFPCPIHRGFFIVMSGIGGWLTHISHLHPPSIEGESSKEWKAGPPAHGFEFVDVPLSLMLDSRIQLMLLGRVGAV